jgi:hypothetical protein
MNKSLHTHTLSMSCAGYLHSFGRVTLVCVILVYHLHALIILTCSMTSFSDRNTCVYYFPCENPNFADFSLFRRYRQHFCSVFVFDKLLNLYYSVSRVLLRPLGGVIFISVGCFITLFILCPFVTKRGSNFYFWTGNVFPNRSSDFCPRMAKRGVFSILSLFCVSTKSLLCNDAVKQGFHFQSDVRRFCLRNRFKFPVNRPDDVSSRPDAHLSTVPSVWTTCHSVRTSDRQASSVRKTYFFCLDTYIVSRSFCASLLRPDVSAARPDAYQFSNGSLILSKFQEREDH